MFKVKVYRGSSLPVGANIALKARLWIPGWALNSELKGCLSSDKTYSRIVSIGFFNGVPVAVIFNRGTEVQAFCRKAYRGNRYASRCLKALKKKDLSANTGIIGSSTFWRKNNVSCYSYGKY